MDLRSQVISQDNIEALKRLAFRGQFSYQPFIVSDDFEVGAGLSILHGADRVPAIICADAAKYGAKHYIEHAVARDDQIRRMKEANIRLDGLYESIVDQISAHIQDLPSITMVDVGCNTGYFPLAFSKRGVKRAVGFDREDYSATFDALNEVLGTNAEFVHRSYDGEVKAPKDHGRFDLVLSVAVLVHLSDPLHHLAYLGSLSQRALFVLTPCHRDDDHSIRFHAANRYYEHDNFPYCFDTTTVSRNLLKFAFESMGFSEIHEFEFPETAMPARWNHVHRGLLGIRPHKSGVKKSLDAARSTIDKARHQVMQRGKTR